LYKVKNLREDETFELIHRPGRFLLINATRSVSKETDMKYGMLMNVMVGAGLMTAPVLVTASGFGGGWVQNPVTRTLYYSHESDRGHQQAAAERHQSVRLNGFGGGWVQNPVTRTLSYSHESDHGHQQAAAERHQSVRLNGFGGGWVQNPVTRTLSYSLAHDRTVPVASAGSHSSLSRLEGGVEPEPARSTF
jgi:hypothetical protein